MLYLVDYIQGMQTAKSMIRLRRSSLVRDFAVCITKRAHCNAHYARLVSYCFLEVYYFVCYFCYAGISLLMIACKYWYNILDIFRWSIVSTLPCLWILKTKQDSWILTENWLLGINIIEGLYIHVLSYRNLHSHLQGDWTYRTGEKSSRSKS